MHNFLYDLFLNDYLFMSNRAILIGSVYLVIISVLEFMKVALLAMMQKDSSTKNGTYHFHAHEIRKQTAIAITTNYHIRAMRTRKTQLKNYTQIKQNISPYL